MIGFGFRVPWLVGTGNRALLVGSRFQMIWNQRLSFKIPARGP